MGTDVESALRPPHLRHAAKSHPQAGEILENANCPVLAVPEDATFDGVIDKIAVATGYTDEDCLAIEKVMDWAGHFDANVYCVHVDSSHTESITHRMDKFKEKFGDNLSIHFINVDVFDIREGLTHFVEEEKVDILAMLTHKRSFFEELFHYSQAKQMSYHTNVPILSIQAHTLKN